MPMGALSRAYPVGGYPFGPIEGVLEWRLELDAWLVGVGRFIYKRVPFAFGLVGFEVDTGETISAENLAMCGIPDKHRAGILRPREGELDWYPSTGP
jgi:hypothetical protein